MTETSALPADTGPVLAADGTPLKRSLARALRRQKIRAFGLVAPLLLFVMITFIFPIGDMLFRSIENQIVAETLPQTVVELRGWDADSGAEPPEAVYKALYEDFFVATEKKIHTRLGTRLNYESSGISSLFRQTGRGVGDIADEYEDFFKDLDADWRAPERWVELMGAPAWLAEHQTWAADPDASRQPAFILSDTAAATLPATSKAYTAFAEFTLDEEDDLADERPWALVHSALYEDLLTADLAAYDGPFKPELETAQAAALEASFPSFRDGFAEIDEEWVTQEPFAIIQTFSPKYTDGYFLAAADLARTPDGIEERPEDERIYLTLFGRTFVMSLAITFMCFLLGYPVAWLLANLRASQANLLMILVLLPFWTSLLVRTSAWKVLLQNQGVINDILVALHIVSDDGRLAMINNQTGTIIAMTHILLPFMILPLYSVMKTIPPSYLRAAKSLGANDWTAFWRVYFPQSIPGIGAGAILVFILSIGYYITPALVGGTSGIFISNRIAYHISSSLNWGLAAALGSILLVVVLLLYWVYDKIVGIDNVKLG